MWPLIAALLAALLPKKILVNPVGSEPELSTTTAPPFKTKPNWSSRRPKAVLA
jgi:hypothetical protein